MSVYAVRDTASGYAVVRWFDGWGREVEIIRMFPTGRAGIRAAVRLCASLRTRHEMPGVAIGATPGPIAAPSRVHRADRPVCDVCQSPIPDAGRGRPRQTCSAACRKARSRRTAA